MEQGLDAFLVESRLLHAKTHRSSKRPAKMRSPFPTEGAPGEPSTTSDRGAADSRNRPTIVGVGLSPDSGRRDSSSSVAADGLRRLRRLLEDRLSVSEAGETRALMSRVHVG